VCMYIPYGKQSLFIPIIFSCYYIIHRKIKPNTGHILHFTNKSELGSQFVLDKIIFLHLIPSRVCVSLASISMTHALRYRSFLGVCLKP
jgi:hypothetical protein